jgi:hypothetical protein
MPPTVNLEVVADLPTAPLVVVEATLGEEAAKLRALAEDVTVSDSVGANQAAEIIKTSTALLGAIEKARTAVKAPFLDICRKIDDAPKVIVTALSQAKASVQAKLTTYVHEMERQARLKREEEERERRAEEERKRKEAEKAAAEGDLIDIDVGTAPRAPLVIARAPAPPAGITMRRTLEYEVVEIGKVPEQFLKSREVHGARIWDAYCRSWTDGAALPVVPGLRFSVKSTPVSTGRR